jgi:hypothetical protein
VFKPFDSPVTDSEYTVRVCGDCDNFGKGTCQYPSGPDAVKTDYSWACACHGWKPKGVTV